MKVKNIIYVFILLPFFLVSAIKTSKKNGNWSSPGTWTPSGVPTSSDKVYIYHTITLDVNVSTLDTIFVYNTLNIASGVVLNLSSGMMVLVNTSSYDGKIGTVGTSGNITGNFIFQKWITRCDGYSTYGSPFTTSISNFDWYYCYQCMGPSWSNLYEYVEATPGVIDNGYNDNIAGTITRGKGFFYWYSNYSGGKNFSRQIALKGSLDFTTRFDFGVTYTPSSGGLSNDGYNLLANPFPGTIDWNSPSFSKRRVDNAIYVWNSCSGSYGSYVSGVGVNGGSRYIPSMQAFWVHTNRSGPRLRATSGVLTATSSSLLKTSSSSDSVDYVLKIKLDDDEIAIRLDSNSTNEMDTLTDAIKFYTDKSRICSVISSDTVDYAINSIKDTNNIIPIKIKGGGSLTFNGVNTFYSQYAIYLKDLVNKTYQPITEGMNYSFSDTSLVTFNKRFEIYFIKNDVTSIKNEILNKQSIIYNNESIFINLTSEFALPVNVKMVDLLGREVYSNTFNQSDIVIPKMEVPVILNVYNKEDKVVKKVF